MSEQFSVVISCSDIVIYIVLYFRLVVCYANYHVWVGFIYSHSEYNGSLKSYVFHWLKLICDNLHSGHQLSGHLFSHGKFTDFPIDNLSGQIWFGQSNTKVCQKMSDD